jgi:protocatechuate 4,5-dioxygenase beta chain
MASIVGGFCVPHDPLITGATEAADAGQAANVFAAFERVKAAVAAMQADTAVVIGDDHFAMFGTGCQPSILIGIGDVEGPIEPWLRIPRRALGTNSALATHIMDYGFRHGFDWSVAKTLSLDHSVMIPSHLALPESTRVIPVYISSGMTPLVRSSRCLELGRMIGDAIRAWPGNERVVVLGTGGISHWVGMADMGKVNVEFDRRIMAMVDEGDVNGLVELADADVVHQAGNGAWEIKNWIVAMAAMPGCRGSSFCYEPIPEWICGLGFTELRQP